jgi:two-component system, chemotaxis family, protein-glutamate methylesterase/glutaminase
MWLTTALAWRVWPQTHLLFPTTARREERVVRHRDIIVIGASAGGLEALRTLVAALPPNLPAALFVVLHVSKDSPGLLPQILNNTGPLPALHAEDGLPIRSGHIYVAPADHHLLLEAGWMRLTHGPKENRFRPAIDPLFRSAAYVFGPQVIGIVLSGMLDDGTAGLWSIKDRGGIAIVQEPHEALYPSMPQSALRYVAVDHRLHMGEIATVLERLVRKPLAEEEEVPMSEALAIETKIALEDHALESGVLQLGQPSLFTCPECHGVMIQIEEGAIVRYRCHTGHAYSQETLLAEIDETIEMGLWSAVRTMDEKVFLLRQLATQNGSIQPTPQAQRFIAKADEVEARSQQLRQFTKTHQATSTEAMRQPAEMGQ